MHDGGFVVLVFFASVGFAVGAWQQVATSLEVKFPHVLVAQ
tara:strand:- start:127 stop:249 length:123 start_codon:yes stop_codon:yes gene_type:complete